MNINLHGHVTWTRYLDGVVMNTVEADNVICSAGLSILCASIAWAGLQDQATNLGISTAGNYMTPMYGAYGSSSTTPTSADTQLGAELGRTIISGASGLSSTVLFQFTFPASTTAYTVSEVGVFCIGTTTTNTGFMLDHALLTDTVPAEQTATLQLQLTVT